MPPTTPTGLSGKTLSGNGSPSGLGPLSNFFRAVEGEAAVFSSVHWVLIAFSLK